MKTLIDTQTKTKKITRSRKTESKSYKSVVINNHRYKGWYQNLNIDLEKLQANNFCRHFHCHLLGLYITLRCFNK